MRNMAFIRTLEKGDDMTTSAAEINLSRRPNVMGRRTSVQREEFLTPARAFWTRKQLTGFGRSLIL